MSTPHTSVDVVVTWAGSVLAVERLAPGEVFTIGPRGRFCCEDPSIPEEAFPVVTHERGFARVAISTGMRLAVDGRDAGASAVELLPGQGSARVMVGPLSFEVRFDRAAAAVRSEGRRDGRFLAASGTALALQAGLVAAFLLTPSPAPDVLPLPTTTTARALFSAPRPPPPRALAPAAPAAEASQVATKARPSPKAPRVPQSARELVRGALAAMGLSGGASPALPGLAGGLGSLRGASTAGVGVDGMGTRLVGPGGGGGTVPVAALWAGGVVDREVDGNVGLIARERRPVVVIDRDFAPTDGLSRDEIQRVLSRALPRIKHCYERELGGAPDLEGKVTSTFTVGGSGAVVAAMSAHTMAEPAVARCVDGVVKTLTFPAPRGGGQVVVTYPFVFTLSGG